MNENVEEEEEKYTKVRDDLKVETDEFIEDEKYSTIDNTTRSTISQNDEDIERLRVNKPAFIEAIVSAYRAKLDAFSQKLQE